MKKFMAGLRYLFMWIGILVVLICVAVILILSSLDFSDFVEESEDRSIPQGDVMVEIDLSGVVSDRFDFQGPAVLFDILEDGDSVLSFEDLKQQILYLKKIPSIKAVLFRIRGDFNIHSNYAIDLMKDMKDLAKIKPVYFAGPLIYGGTHFLMAGAHEIVLAPGGQVYIPSPAMAQFLLGRAMKRFGVGVEVIKAGIYKNFSLHLDQADPESNRQLYSVYDSYIRVLRDYMKQSRFDPRMNPTLTAKHMAQWFKQVHYESKEALDRKMVTQISHLQPFKDKIAAKRSLEWTHDRQIDWEPWASQYIDTLEKSEDDQGEQTQLESPDVSIPKGGVWARLEQAITSTIDQAEKEYEYHSLGYLSYSGTITLDNGDSSSSLITEIQVEKEVDHMLEQNHVKAVVVRINSPGGGVLASELIWSELKRLSAQKPVVAYIDSMAASGGYYMASAADQIVVRPTAITGSVGVLMIRPHMAGASQKYGVDLDVVTRQKYADMNDLTTQLSARTKLYLNERIQDAYDLFCQRVAQSRGLTKQQVHQNLAQGRIWTGAQAHQIALVDKLGNRNDAFRVAKELAGLDPEKTYPVEFARQDFSLLKTCLTSPTDCLRLLDSSHHDPFSIFDYSLITGPNQTILHTPQFHRRLLARFFSTQPPTQLIQAHLYLPPTVFGF